MSADFVSLADLLRPRTPRLAAAAPESPTAQPEEQDVAQPDEHDITQPDERCIAEPEPGPIQSDSGDAHDDESDDMACALRDARLFRARLADAFDDAAARLVRELAADVLARELRLAPCDLSALVERVLDRAPVVRVRVAPADVASVRGVPVVADTALRAGDAVVELAGGALDGRLGVRLAAVLEAFA